MPDPGGNPALERLKQLQQQHMTERNTALKQKELDDQQFTRNALTAQRSALDQSHMLQAGPAPRTITDTSMTIGSGGETEVQQNSRTASGGGGTVGTRQLPPDLQGRFMPLVELGQQSIPGGSGAMPPPRATMPDADFSPGDATAHQDAAFSRLKDRAGLLGKGALDTLSSQLAGRGIGGASGAFGRGLADILAQTTQPLADLNVAHLQEEYGAADRARALSEQRASNVYSGDITQRGQDIQTQMAIDQLKASLLRAKYEGEIAQRGQDLNSIYRLL